MKSNKGISLVVLIIVIVIMIILFGVIMANVDSVQEEANAMEFLNDMSIIETKVMIEQYNAGTAEAYTFVGTKLTSSNRMTVGNTTYPFGAGDWYVLNDNELELIGVTDIKGTYIVNYSTCDVVSVEGVRISGEMYYTFESVAEKMDFEY